MARARPARSCVLSAILLGYSSSVLTFARDPKQAVGKSSREGLQVTTDSSCTLSDIQSHRMEGRQLSIEGFIPPSAPSVNLYKQVRTCEPLSKVLCFFPKRCLRLLSDNGAWIRYHDSMVPYHLVSSPPDMKCDL